MLETFQALLTIVLSGLFVLLLMPLWPIGIWAFIEWQRLPPAPDLDSAVA